MKAVIFIISTVVIFLIMNQLYKKCTYPFLLPLLTTTIIVIIILLSLNIPYADYMEGGQYIQHLLGPAVVGLAFPLYNQRHLISKYKFTIISGIFIAMISGLFTVYFMLRIFKLDESYILTALPKSLTTPIAMQVSETINGIPPLTAVLVMIAGFGGALFGPFVYKLGKIQSPISRGISMGSASHGVGISKLRDYSEEDLSMGSLAMGLSAIVGAILCPIFVMIFF